MFEFQLTEPTSTFPKLFPWARFPSLLTLPLPRTLSPSRSRASTGMTTPRTVRAYHYRQMLS